MFRALSLILAALLVAPAAFGAAREQCADLIIQGDTPDTTSATTTAVSVVFLSADQNEIYDPAGAWAIGDADFAEWCWTAPPNVDRGDFLVTWSGDFSQSGTTTALDINVGVDVDSTIAAGDEIASQAFEQIVAAADELALSRTAFTNIEDGGCIGLMVDADSTVTLTVDEFTVDVKQISSGGVAATFGDGDPCNH